MKNELKLFILKRIEELKEELIKVYKLSDNTTGIAKEQANTRIQYLEQHLRDLEEVKRICVDRNRF